LSIDSTSITSVAGGTVLFTGTITNETGTALNATDLFLNFSGFDPLSLESITQLLGSPDFTLGNMATSSSVDLFEVQIAQGILPGAYPVDVSLQDINNDVSNGVLVSVSITSSTATPEPQVLLLLASGMAVVMIWWWVAPNRRSRERKNV
jgi:type 1 fimbria pilin